MSLKYKVRSRWVAATILVATIFGVYLLYNVFFSTSPRKDEIYYHENKLVKLLSEDIMVGKNKKYNIAYEQCTITIEEVIKNACSDGGGDRTWRTANYVNLRDIKLPPVGKFHYFDSDHGWIGSIEVDDKFNDFNREIGRKYQEAYKNLGKRYVGGLESSQLYSDISKTVINERSIKSIVEDTECSGKTYTRAVGKLGATLAIRGEVPNGWQDEIVWLKRNSCK